MRMLGRRVHANVQRLALFVSMTRQGTDISAGLVH